MENKIVEEVIVNEIPETVNGGMSNLGKGALVFVAGAVAVKVVEKTATKVVIPATKKIASKIKTKKAEKNGQEVNDHEDGYVHEI